MVSEKAFQCSLSYDNKENGFLLEKVKLIENNREIQRQLAINRWPNVKGCTAELFLWWDDKIYGL